MVLHGGLCGRVGRRRTIFRFRGQPSGWPLKCFYGLFAPTVQGECASWPSPTTENLVRVAPAGLAREVPVDPLRDPATPVVQAGPAGPRLRRVAPDRSARVGERVDPQVLQGDRPARTVRGPAGRRVRAAAALETVAGMLASSLGSARQGIRRLPPGGTGRLLPVGAALREWSARPVVTGLTGRPRAATAANVPKGLRQAEPGGPGARRAVEPCAPR
jgi:hypothetical protein